MTPTDVANEVFCPRLFFINKMLKEKKTITSIQMVAGSLEHEAFRILAECFDTTWRKNVRPSLKEVSQSDIERTLDHVYNLAIQSYPQFALQLKNGLSELHYRINLWIAQKEKSMKKIIHDGFTRDYAVSTLLPWKTEDALFSNEHGLYGRADAIYNDGRTLIPEDLKTHTSKFSALLYHTSHRAQLLCYSILVEEKYDMPSKEARVFYSKDVSYSSFKTTSSAKENLITRIHSVREKLSAGLPPMLEGEESIKCQYCYARSTCFRIAKEQHTDEWIDKLTGNTSEVQFDLFGDDKNAG